MKHQIMKEIKLYSIIVASIFLLSCSNTENALPVEEVNDSTLVQPAQDINKVVGIGLIVPESLIAELSVQQSARITKIYKNIGDRVLAGEPIIQLDNVDEQLAIKKLQQQKITQLYQVQVAEADLGTTQTQLEYKKSKLKTSKSLLDKGAETRENIDDLENDVKSLEATLKLKQASLEVARSQKLSLETDIKIAENNIEKKVVKAPSDGQILQIDAVLYSWVSQNEPVVSFSSDGSVVARCEVDEMFAGKIDIGQKAEIRNIGYSKVIATGEVVELSPILSRKSLFVENPTDQQDRRVRDVRIRIDNPEGLIFNSRVECTIIINDK